MYMYIVQNIILVLSVLFCSGSGSTYIYGYCDSQFKRGMSREECIQFVKNCKLCAFSH